MIEESKESTKERVVLDDDTLSILKIYQEQFEKEFSGVVKLNLKQLVNFLIVERQGSMTKDELQKVRAKFADKVKILQAIVDRAKAARRDGQEYSIDADLKIFETLSVTENLRARKPRKKRSEGVLTPEIQNEVECAKEPMADNSMVPPAQSSNDERPRKSRANAKNEGD